MRYAFTLMELIFVLVVIGILTVYIVPQTRQNNLELAARQLIGDLRYTQQLSMRGDTYNKDNVWYQDRWRVKFYKGSRADNELSYTICNEEDSRTNIKVDSIAKNPQNHNQLMTGGHTSSDTEKNKIDIRKKEFIGMKRLNIGKTYNIKKYKLSGGCRYSRISFDYLGRPLQNDPNKLTHPYKKNDDFVLISSPCNIKLTSKNNKSITIVIEPETGYMKIEY